MFWLNKRISISFTFIFSYCFKSDFLFIFTHFLFYWKSFKRSWRDIWFVKKWRINLFFGVVRSIKTLAETILFSKRCWPFFFNTSFFFFFFFLRFKRFFLGFRFMRKFIIIARLIFILLYLGIGLFLKFFSRSVGFYLIDWLTFFLLLEHRTDFIRFDWRVSLLLNAALTVDFIIFLGHSLNHILAIFLKSLNFILVEEFKIIWVFWELKSFLKFDSKTIETRTWKINFAPYVNTLVNHFEKSCWKSD